VLKSMASPASTEANEVRRRGRRRLIGAVAIVILLVVFVPMILDSQPGAPRDEPVLAIPPKDQVAPLPVPAERREPAASARATAPAAPAPAPATVPPATTAPATATAAPHLVGFAVQVGAFRDEATLEQARAKVAAAGIPHYIERLGGAAGGLTRLRAGPFTTRSAAEAALPRLHKASLDGQVVTLP
jgi:DedD protein